MQAILTKYHGPSSVKGSRISAECDARKIFVPYDHALNADQNHREAARKLVKILGWKGAYRGGALPRNLGWAWTWSGRDSFGAVDFKVGG